MHVLVQLQGHLLNLRCAQEHPPLSILQRDLELVQQLRGDEDNAFLSDVAAAAAELPANTTPAMSAADHGHPLTDFELARILQAQEDALASAVRSRSEHDLPRSAIVGAGSAAATAARHDSKALSDNHRGVGLGRMRETDVMPLVGDIKIVDAAEDVADNAGGEEALSYCHEDVCPDIHEMFRYFDEIYFGCVSFRVGAGEVRVLAPVL